MIDLHSHLLPAVDDGARTLEQAVAVLGELGRHGVTDICLTPHLLASHAEVGIPPQHDAAFARLRVVAPESPRLHRAVEIMLDRPLPDAAVRNPALRIAGSRYVLVEFPRMVAAATVARALQHVVALGLVPLLAHPERYSSCTVDTVERWRRIGARMQVDASTLLAPSARGERARALLGAGLADLIAADNHGDKRSIGPTYAAMIEQGGTEQAEALAVGNPRAVLEDRDLVLVEPAAIKLPWRARLRRFMGGADH